MTTLTERPAVSFDNPSSRDDAALYVELKHRVRDAGLFKTTPWFYVAQVSFWAGITLAILATLVLVDSLLVRVLLAPIFAVVMTHISYLAHDAGHRQLFKTTKLNDLALLILDPIVGLSPSWWMDAHNAHHSFPNDSVHDPNLRVPVLSFSQDQLRAKGPIMRFVVRFQAWYYVPLVMLETLNMRITSITFLLKGGRYRLLELAGLATYIGSYFAFVFIVMGPWEGALFALIHQTRLGLYLGMVFAPNHKGMDVLDNDREISYLERQLITTRNVAPGLLTDFMMGGLNYQVEHHLFPHVPRCRLNGVRRIVKPFCEQHNLFYYETSLWRSYAEMFSFFNKASRDVPEHERLEPAAV
jgi:fatty acid desaturase